MDAHRSSYIPIFILFTLCDSKGFDIDSCELDCVTTIRHYFSQWKITHHYLVRSYQYHDEPPIKKFAETLPTSKGLIDWENGLLFTFSGWRGSAWILTKMECFFHNRKQQAFSSDYSLTNYSIAHTCAWSYNEIVHAGWCVALWGFWITA